MVPVETSEMWNPAVGCGTLAHRTAPVILDESRLTAVVRIVQNYCFSQAERLDD
jgi:hypothetical protein